MLFTKETAVFGLYDFEIVHTVPTALGRYFGYKPGWSVCRVDKHYGYCTVNNQTFRLGRQVKVERPVNVSATTFTIRYTNIGEGNIEQTVRLLDFGGVIRSHLTTDGELIQQPESDTRLIAEAS